MTLPAPNPAHTATGVFLFGVLLLGPVLWVVASAAATDLGTTQAVLRAAGLGTGIVGLAWLLLAMLLGIRIPGTDVPFGGLLKIWRVHHWLGAASFLALLAHPLLLGLAAASAGPTVVLATLLPDWSHWPLWAGWLALLVMMAFMAPSFSFFGAPHYQRWKNLHRLSGIAAVLGIAHAIPLGQLLPPVPALWFWSVFAFLGLGALAWRLGLSRLLSRKRYLISKVTELARGVVELTLEGPPLRFQPGQFVYLTPLDPELSAGRGEEHPYAIVSAPREPVIRIAIKDLGDASGALLQVNPGTHAWLEGPYGRFLPVRYDEPALWVGGGIGLTPFVSAARAFDDTPYPIDVHLIYCANDPSRAYFLEELQGIAAQHPGFHVHAHTFIHEGRLSADFLRSRVSDLTGRKAYICGPPPLINLTRRLLHGFDVPAKHIHSEEFTLL
jgi:predicted ferric reductase